MRVKSLTTRFLLALLMFSALPFLGFGLYVRSEVRNREQQQVVQVTLPRWADDAAKKIADNLSAAQNAGYYLTKFADQHLLAEGGGIPMFEEFVAGLFHVNPGFDMVILADAAGSVLSVTRSPSLDADELLLLQPKSVARFGWFDEVGRKGRPRAWVDRHLSPFLHRNPDKVTLDPADYSVGMAFAVHMPDGKKGALYVLLRWKQIQAVVDEMARFLRSDAGYASAAVFLCDASGAILAHSDRARYGSDLPAALLCDSVLARERGGDLFQAEDGVRYGIGFASSMAHFRGFHWHIGLYAPTRELYELSREFGRWLLLVIPLTAVLLAGLALLSSRAIIRPLRRLSDATRQVASGDLTTRVDARGGDELADLGRAFNTMAEELSESRELLRVAERQSAWAEMARQIAHEIKNPLTPMRMSAQLLLRARREDDPRWPELAERLARNVVEQTDALDRIASDFRQFAGSPARDVRVVPADALLSSVEDLVSDMAETPSVGLTFAPGAGDARVAVDLQEMRRVFLNLIHNALQACGASGSVKVSSRLADGDASAVQYRVVDDGPGVPDDVRRRLFEPYFTTKSSGTGLGLAICRRILDAHHGEVRLEESVVGHTVFLVTLPTVRSSDGPGPG
ncbi:MAG: sensor histidine kinase [Planctomycetes bacterium]|nr:sensor histidine kinase [Planctomycetota bacterium]